MHVVQVLGPAGQHFGDDHVFGADDRHRDIAQADRHGPREEQILEARATEHEVQRQAALEGMQQHVGVAGWSRTVTSTSAVSLGRPQIRVACAPKTYHPTLTADRASASAASRSTGAVSGDGAEGARHAEVHGEIGRSVRGVRPAGTHRRCVPAERVGGEGLCHGDGAFPLHPVAVRLSLNRLPVALDERPDISGIHDGDHSTANTRVPPRCGQSEFCPTS